MATVDKDNNVIWNDFTKEGVMIENRNIDVEIVTIEGTEIPEYSHKDDAGFDFRYRGNDFILESGERAILPTGIKMKVPKGFNLEVRPRSGLAARNGITVLNAPGTVDCGYINEIGVILQNTDENVFLIKNGMRIAQGVLCPVYKCNFIPVESLDDTERGLGGFGSTGVE